MLIDRRTVSRFDWGLVGATLLIPFLGCIVLYSAGFDPDGAAPLRWLPDWFKSQAVLKQLTFLAGGIAVSAIIASLPTVWWYRAAYPIYTAGVSLLIAVDIFGKVSKGSQRWLVIGGMSIQPAEFMKLGVILALARYLSRAPTRPGGLRLLNIIIPFLIFLIPMGLIMKQPDLGTALALGGVGFMMVLFIGINIKTLLLMFFLVTAAVPFGWSRLHDYQQNRIRSVINPDLDPKGTGYHVRQSKIAVGSGQVFGKGFLAGTQSQLEFLPEHTTDFIFSVLAEEWGFIGCSTVLVAYFFLLYRLLRVAAKTRDLFQVLLVVGISSLIFFHTAVNIGMVIGILPVVGIPLPLFSYGGSSVLATMVGVGIVLGVSVRRGFV